jgi:hypothetical protein
MQITKPSDADVVLSGSDRASGASRRYWFGHDVSPRYRLAAADVGANVWLWAGIVTPMQRQDWRQDLAQKVRLSCFIAGIRTLVNFDRLGENTRRPRRVLSTTLVSGYSRGEEIVRRTIWQRVGL